MQKLQKTGSDYKLTEIGEIPNDWQVKPLSDICSSFTSGGTPSTKNPEFWNGEIPWIRSAWIKEHYVTHGEKYITSLGVDNSATNIIPKDSLIVATRVSIGNVAINKIDVAISQDLTGIIVDKSRTSEEYLYWTLLRIKDTIRSYTQGSTIQGLIREDLKNIKVPFPPFLEQQKISSILSKLEKLIQNTDQIIVQTQRLKKGLMRRLFTKGIKHTTFRKSEAGSIPDDWGDTQLGNVATVSTGSNPSTLVREYYLGDIPFIRTAEIVNQLVNNAEVYISRKAVDDYSLTVYSPRTVLLAMYGQGKTRGQSALLNIPATISQNAAAISCNEVKLDPLYLWYYLLYSYSVLRGLGNIGHISHLNLTFVKKFNIPLPSLTEQKRISSILSNMDLKIKKGKGMRDQVRHS